MRHPAILTFIDRFEGAYSSGYFLTLKESHDSFVFWKVRQQMEQDKEAKFRRIGSSLTKTHVFILRWHRREPSRQ